MYIVRFIGVVIAAILAMLIAYVTKIELPNILSVIAFILIVDNLICKAIINIYMRSVLENMEKGPNDKGDE